jgi:hypothetical protein
MDRTGLIPIIKEVTVITMKVASWVQLDKKTFLPKLNLSHKPGKQHLESLQPTKPK